MIDRTTKEGTTKVNQREAGDDKGAMREAAGWKERRIMMFCWSDTEAYIWFHMLGVGAWPNHHHMAEPRWRSAQLLYVRPPTRLQCRTKGEKQTYVNYRCASCHQTSEVGSSLEHGHENKIDSFFMTLHKQLRVGILLRCLPVLNKAGHLFAFIF